MRLAPDTSRRLPATVAVTCVALLLLPSCHPDDSQPGEVQADDAPPDEDQAGAVSSDEPKDPTSGTDSEESEGQGPVSEASWDPSSLHVLVNKANPLEPEDHAPEDLEPLELPQTQGDQQLRAEPAEALGELFAAAEEDEVELLVASTYRSFETQADVYERHSANLGRQEADRVSARPGHSEHQTGLTVDLSYPGNDECYLRECFGETPAGQWLAENAQEFGFIIRYPQDAEHITGYSYEPWHLRYVGGETAAAVAESDATLEEYWSQPPAPDYE